MISLPLPKLTFSFLQTSYIYASFCSSMTEASNLQGYDNALLYTLPQNVWIQLTSITASYFRRMESSYAHITFPYICSLFYTPHVTA